MAKREPGWAQIAPRTPSRSAPRRPGGWATLLWVLAACQKPSADEGRPIEPPPSPAAAPVEASAPPPAEVEPAADATAEAPEPVAEPVPTFGPAALTVLSDDDRATLLAGPADPFMEVEIHYIQSNETRHDLYFPYIADKGGAYIGVGSDQNFTLMAAARSELAFLIDIDSRVVDLHRMYEVFVSRAETPEALVEMWNAPQEAASVAVLREALHDLPEKDVRRIVSGYRVGRETVYRHLLRVIGRTRDGRPTSWLSDPEMYAHVRAMYQTGRVRMMAGNLAGETSLHTIAAAARALGVPVRVLYMSNAEEYFKYTPTFVGNIEALPIDEQSVLLRTIYSKKWEHADLWAYQVQPLVDFRGRLADRRNRSRNPMLRYAEQEGALDRNTGLEGFTRVGIAGT